MKMARIVTMPEGAVAPQNADNALYFTSFRQEDGTDFTADYQSFNLTSSLSTQQSA